MTDQHTRFSDIAFEFFIRPERMGEYLLVPLEVPENVESLALAYDYPTHSHPTQSLAEGTFTARVRENTIDLGLVAPDGRQVGASGADKREIFISATQAIQRLAKKVPPVLHADTQPLWVAAFATMWPTGVTMCELPKYSTPAGSAPMALAPMT